MRRHYPGIPYLFYSIIFFFFAAPAFAVTVQGVVLDGRTREPLIGATIAVKNTKLGTAVSLSGTFKLSISSPGQYTLVASFIGYKTVEKVITIAGQDVSMDFELEENGKELSEVVVTALLDKTTDQFAQMSEKNASSISNVMSAKTIQLMPDITVANLLQRFSGVSVDRNSSGDAQYAIIRGMPQRYSYTLVNGIKIPSPDNNNRYVPMDLFPADLLDRLEVIKALTPSMEGDAAGGAMNLVMKDAPEDFTVTANVASGTNMNAVKNGFTTFKGWQNSAPVQTHPAGYVATPSDFSFQDLQLYKAAPVNQVYGFSIGGRITKDRRLGGILATSVQDVYRSTSTLFIVPDPNVAPNNLPQFDDWDLRQYSSHQKRYGVHAKLDYRLSEKHHLKLYSMLVELDEIQQRHTIDTSLSVGRNGPGNAIVYLYDRSRLQKQSIYNLTLQGDHFLMPHLKANWSAVYSKASNAMPDWSENETSQQVGYGKVILTNQRLYYLNKYWQHNSDTDYSGYLNLLFDGKINDRRIDISAGGLYRDKSRDNTFYYYKFIPISTATFLEGVNQVNASQWQFGGSSAAQGNLVNPNTYSAQERVFAAYVQGNYQWTDNLEVLGGVRAEHTYIHYGTLLDPVSTAAVTGTYTYLDILPSIHFKYKRTPFQNIRASYYRSINRQGFFELPPTAFPGNNFTETGNPNLKHSTIDNLDIRFEQFSKVLNQILVGVFYKYLNNPIETFWGNIGISDQAIFPQNVGNASNFGAEFSVTRYWGRFGLSGNYTFTQSQLTTSKLYYTANFQTTNVSQTRPLQGQAKHIGNLSFLYKDVEHGVNLQLAFAYTGTRIALVSPYQNLDYWQQPMLTMDFSAEKQLFKNFTFYVKVQNILDTPYLVYLPHHNIYTSGPAAIPSQTDPNKILVQRDYYGQNFIGGIRYKFLK